MRARAYPFIRPSTDLFLTINPWVLTEPISPNPPEEGIPGWDYSQNVTLNRNLSINIDSLSEECRMVRATFLCTVHSLTGPSALRDELWRSDVLSGGLAELSVKVAPNSHSLHQSLSLTTSIIVCRPGEALHLASPRLPGSRLWHDEIRIDIRGTLGRMPMSPVPFADWFPESPNALWRLVWDQARLDEPVTSMLLYVNSGREDLIENLENPVTVSAIKSDIVFQMILPVLSDDDLLAEIDEYDNGTVGGLICTWLRMLEETTSRDILSQMARNSVDLLILRIQSRMTAA